MIETAHWENYLFSKAGERWLTNSAFKEFEKKFKKRPEFIFTEIGKSFEGRVLKNITWGKGRIKVLLWSQMHGNEPTASLAFLDLWNFLTAEDQYNDLRNMLSTQLTLHFIPQLNPDGAEAFTRRNAQNIDINRDALAQQTPEMKAFQQILKNEQPDWCFNLHDQRNIFSLGAESHPATISFLSPSADESRKYTKERKYSMKLISSMVKAIQSIHPANIGRFTDEFYPLAIGDNLHKLKIPTVLIETGAYYNDPNRMEARKLLFISLLKAFESIANGDWKKEKLSLYEQLPVNEQHRRDLIIRNCKITNGKQEASQLDLAFLAKEFANKKSCQLEQHWVLHDIGDLKHLKGFKEIEGGEIVSSLQELELNNCANLKIKTKQKSIEFKQGLWVV